MSFIPARNIPNPIRNPSGTNIHRSFLWANLIALCWFTLSLFLSRWWIADLSELIGNVLAFIVVANIALIPGFLNMFLLGSLFFDRFHENHHFDSSEPISVIIAAYNEEDFIASTVKSILDSHYCGPIRIVVVDDGSTDDTAEIVQRMGLSNVDLIRATHNGKAKALNLGLELITTDLVVVVDADTVLHPEAITRIVSRMKALTPDTAAVAGAVLAGNHRKSLMTRIQYWDYFLGIASIKRQQAMYNSTLVAQGAFSLFRTDLVKQDGGWPSCVGEDIALTWGLLKRGYYIGHEPTAVGFTHVPTGYFTFARQRRRWARGLIEAFRTNGDVLKTGKPVTRYLVALDLFFPPLDITYTFIFIPGIVAAFLGKFWVAGPMTLAVLPLSLAIYFFMYKRQMKVLSPLGVSTNHDILGFTFYLLFYQALMSPVCVWGYIEEFLHLNKSW